jgi:hypothetical protein
MQRTAQMPITTGALERAAAGCGSGAWRSSMGVAVAGAALGSDVMVSPYRHDPEADVVVAPLRLEAQTKC